MKTARKRAPRCELCGHSHARLNVRIENKNLLRTVTKDTQRIRAFGGAWGFNAQFWDAHSAQIHRVQVLDAATGLLYHASIDDFVRYAFRRVLDKSGRAGEQIIMPFRYWKQLDTRSGPGDGATLENVAQAAPPMETARALEMYAPPQSPETARPVFGDVRMIAALRRAHRR